MEEVTIYTDGACSGNPGKGGWGAILIYGDVKKEISGAEKMTTNNKMELTAPIEALKLLKRPCKVKLYSDSAYLINAFVFIIGLKMDGKQLIKRMLKIKNCGRRYMLLLRYIR